MHKIGVENWCPSSHKFGLSTSLASFLYRIGTGSPFNYVLFILNQVIRHGSQVVKILLCFPRLICDMILNQHFDILLQGEAPSPIPLALLFSYKLYQGKHVPDLGHTDVLEMNVGPSHVFLNTSCGKRIVHMFANKSKKVGFLI